MAGTRLALKAVLWARPVAVRRFLRAVLSLGSAAFFCLPHVAVSRSRRRTVTPEKPIGPIRPALAAGRLESETVCSWLLGTISDAA